MKKFALGLAAVMTASLFALPLAACGGNAGEFNLGIDLTRYAIPLDDVLTGSAAPKGAYTKADAYTGTVSSLFGSSDSTVIRVQNANSYLDNDITLYDAATNTQIGGYYSSVNISSSHFAIGTTTGSEAGTNTYDVISETGQVLVDDAATYPAINPNATKYVDGTTRKTLIAISYKADATDATETVIYFVRKNNRYTRYTESPLQDSLLDTSVGATLDGINAQTSPASDLYSEDDADKRTALDAYTYSERETAAGKTQYAFYKYGKRYGALTLEANETPLVTIGTCLFYQKRTVVDPYAAKGFNAVYTGTTGSGGTSVKAMIEYYRYDIAKDSVSEVKSDYIFTGSAALLYNNRAESYDLAVANAVKKQDGIAYIEMGSSGYHDSRLVIRANGSVKDISDSLYDVGTVVKLKENRYYVAGDTEGYILDTGMRLVASIPSAILTGKGFVFRNDARYGLADFDGKVLMSDRYESLSFYGDKAMTRIYANDHFSEEAYIVSVQDPQGKAVSSVVSCDESAGEILITKYDGLIVKSTDDGYTVYNYNGSALGETIAEPSIPQMVCNRYWTVSAGGTTYLYR